MPVGLVEGRFRIPLSRPDEREFRTAAVGARAQPGSQGAVAPLCFVGQLREGAHGANHCAQRLDCQPMSGLDAEFFPDGSWRTNFLLNIGYGDRNRLHPRLPRLGFDEVARWQWMG